MDKYIKVFVTLAFVVVLTASAAAQPGGVVGRVSTWSVERAAWPAFEGFVSEKVVPILDAKLTDGTIVDWGFTRRALHTPEESHALWTVAKTQGGLLKAEEAIEAALAGSEGELNAILANVKSHTDTMVRSAPYVARETSVDSGYIIVATMTVRTGQDARFDEWWKTNIQPMLQRLFEEGAVISYGVDREEYVVTPRQRTVWLILGDADAVDKHDAAFMEHFGARSEAELRGIFDPVFRDILEADSFRSYLSSVLHYRARP